jgi:hypothetical protein
MFEVFVLNVSDGLHAAFARAWRRPSDRASESGDNWAVREAPSGQLH